MSAYLMVKVHRKTATNNSVWPPVDMWLDSFPILAKSPSPLLSSIFLFPIYALRETGIQYSHRIWHLFWPFQVVWLSVIFILCHHSNPRHFVHLVRGIFWILMSAAGFDAPHLPSNFSRPEQRRSSGNFSNYDVRINLRVILEIRLILHCTLATLEPSRKTEQSVTINSSQTS